MNTVLIYVEYIEDTAERYLVQDTGYVLCTYHSDRKFNDRFISIYIDQRLLNFRSKWLMPKKYSHS